MQRLFQYYYLDTSCIKYDAVLGAFEWGSGNYHFGAFFLPNRPDLVS